LESIQSISGTLESVGEFSAALAGTGWATDFSQLDRGLEHVGLKVALTVSTVLMQVDFANKVHQIALPPAGLVTFGLPSHFQTPGRMGRRPLESETLTCFNAASGLDAVTAPGFGAYTLSFDAGRISELAELVGAPDPSLTTPRHGVQHHLKAEELSRLRSFLEQFFATHEQCEPTALRNAQRALETDLPMEIIEAWSDSEVIPYVAVSNRSRALRRAMDYIHSVPQPVVSVEELCRASASSMSTLERAFREHYGVSPKQYLIAIRLGGVRKILLCPQETRTIGDIAADWGFWHMSKFAADYKRMFGQLPSATRAATVKIRDKVRQAR
jgi:AraC family ethanolamine operon transcriptional activator